MRRIAIWTACFCVAIFACRGGLAAEGESPTPEDHVAPKQTGIDSPFPDEDYVQIIAKATRDIERDPQCAAAYFERGKAYRALEKLDEAIQDYQRAVELVPDCAEYHVRLAGPYYARGDFDRVIAILSEAIRLDSRVPLAYCYRGAAYFRKERFAEAILDFSEAVHLNPTDATAVCNRCAVYLAQEEYDLALADANEVIRLAPNDARGYYSRSSAFAGKSDYEQVIGDATHAIELDPNLTAAYFNRGRAYADLDAIDKAIEDFDRAIELESQTAIYYIGRGDCYYCRHEYEPALADYDAAIRLDPGSPYAYERRGAVRIERGDYDGGLNDLQTVIRLNPNDPAAGFEAGAEAPADAAGLDHGETELRRMLEDRPVMAQYGDAASPLSQWAVRMFAGEGPDQRVFWDAAEPWPGMDAMCHPRDADSPARIHVRREYGDGPNKGEAMPFERLWQGAVFELFNVGNSEQFVRIAKQAAAGELSKNDYVRQNIDGEAHAAERTRAFYIHVFLPWAREHNVPTHPGLWYIGWRYGPNDNLLRGRFTGTRYWQHHEQSYDLITLHSLISGKKFLEALNLAAEIRREDLCQEANAVVGKYTSFALHALLIDGKYQDVIDLAAKQSTESQTDEEKRFIAVCTGFCLFGLNRAAEAADAYSEAIRFAPADANAYQARAAAYCACSDWEHAIADCNEVVRLRPVHSDSYRFRAAVYQRMGRQDHAESDLATAKLLSELGGVLK